MKKSKFINIALIKIIISSILLIISLFIKTYKNVHLTILILSYIIVGYDLYIKTFKSICNKEFFSEFLLMILATIGAFYIKKYFEGVLVVILYQLGEYLSDLAIDKSKSAIINLLDLRSDYTHVKREKGLEKINARDLNIGDEFVVKKGEKIPLDGIVTFGQTAIDSSSLTGESLPKSIKEGDVILSGTINLGSPITIKATSLFLTSTASKIIEIIENSNEKKTKTERFITRFSKVYTPIVIVFALLIVIIPTLLNQDFNTWLYRGLEFLVISCPCALVISAPLGFFCGIGRSSKESILIKGSDELDRLASIKAIVFDKTGTLTKGNFEVDKICNSSLVSKEELLKIAAHAEIFSNHPISKAIIKKYQEKIDESIINNYTEIPGLGVECKINNDKIYVGTIDLLKSHNINVKIHKNEVGTIVYIGRNKEYLGHIMITDIIKKEAYNLVNELDKIGIHKVIMLSGDDIKVVKKVGKEINFKEFYGNLLPHEKVEKVIALKEKYLTAFVGDGINDAPVIKLSDIGIAMGGIGSDITIEASDIILMKDDLNNIPKAIKISRMTKGVIRFNIIFTLVFKTFALVFATLGYTKVWMAVMADVGVTLITVLNSLTIMKRKI